MPVPLAALFASAIYLERSAVAEPEEIAKSVKLLYFAAEGENVSFEMRGDDLLINGTPLSLEAPGTAIIRHALVDHHTVRLMFPTALTALQWRDVMELFASAPGLYPTVDDLRDALRCTIPDAVVAGTSGEAAEGDLRQSLFELPGLRGAGSASDVTRSVDAHDIALAELSAQLDPLLRVAAKARANADYDALAQVLLQMHELAVDKDAEHRAIVARERRRVVPSEVLEAMARRVPRAGASGVVTRVLGLLGNDGAAALLDALAGATGPHERRSYIDALVAAREADTVIVEALGNERTELVRDAAEVVGRKRLEQAVPLLAHLLRHSKVDVRTTAWHALELIGTRDAVKALRA
jgi:HEAT repeats